MAVAPSGLLHSPLDTGAHEKHSCVFQECSYSLYGENLGVEWIATVAGTIIWVNSAKTLQIKRAMEIKLPYLMQ